MGSETATKSRETKRAATTQELMSNIMTGGEISKKREAELAKAADAGRGIQFIEGSPKVKGLTQKGGKPVFRTGATAADYTGRIAASAPTFGEMAGDMARAVFGGKAKDPAYLRSGVSSAPGKTTKDYMQYTPKPRQQKGIVPSLISKGGLVGMAMSSIMGKEDIMKETPAEKRRRIYEKGVKDYSTLLGGQRNQKGGLIK
jgi:hypothetical protein